MNEIIGIIPHKFRRRGFGVACTLLLRAGLNFLGLAVLLPVLALVQDDMDRFPMDGQALAEPYLLEPMALPQKPEMQGTRFQVEADSLFLLGDNRNGSTDSRHSGVGSVHRDCLLGRAVAVIWPLDRLRLL